jgi:hypothetical protein
MLVSYTLVSFYSFLSKGKLILVTCLCPRQDDLNGLIVIPLHLQVRYPANTVGVFAGVPRGASKRDI